MARSSSQKKKRMRRLSLANVVARVLSEMAPQEEVVESESRDEVEPIEAPSLAFGEKKEGELLAEISIKQLVAQIIEEVEPIEQPPSKVIVHAIWYKLSPYGSSNKSSCEPVFQTPLATKSTPDSTACFYEHFVANASHPLI